MGDGFRLKNGNSLGLQYERLSKQTFDEILWFIFLKYVFNNSKIGNALQQNITCSMVNGMESHVCLLHPEDENINMYVIFYYIKHVVSITLFRVSIIIDCKAIMFMHGGSWKL